MLKAQLWDNMQVITFATRSYEPAFEKIGKLSKLKEYISMNAKTRRRLTVVTGIIIISMIVVLAIVGGGASAKAISVAEAASGDYVDQRVEVSGNVVKNSFSTADDVLTFSIYDEEDESVTLQVRYEGGVSATFGNDVTAICTGTMDAQGVLQCSELVTKCPSKYETSTDALTVERFLGYGTQILDTTVKLKGVVQAGSQAAAGSDDRFVLGDTADANETVAVVFDGALSEETIADGATVVVTGNLVDDGKFHATNVALEG